MPGHYLKHILNEIGKTLMNYVDKNFDDVGCDFAKEALKIHYGVTEPRNIKGVSTDQEEKTLKEEGIQFFKFPTTKPSEADDTNDTNNTNDTDDTE